MPRRLPTILQNLSIFRPRIQLPQPYTLKQRASASSHSPHLLNRGAFFPKEAAWWKKALFVVLILEPFYHFYKSWKHAVKLEEQHQKLRDIDNKLEEDPDYLTEEQKEKHERFKEDLNAWARWYFGEYAVYRKEGSE